MNNSTVPHFPLSAPPLLRQILPQPKAITVDIAYPSPNELIKGAVSKVLLRFVYLCINAAPQITQTKGLSELLI